MSGGNWVGGGIVSLDPLVTYSRGGHPRQLGLAGLYPRLFRNRRALNFIALSRSIQTFDMDAFAEDFKRLQSDLGDNLLVMVANDDHENLQLSRRGIPSFPASHLVLIDETVFRPLPPPVGAPNFDAVYNGRLDALKRHELAANIASLMLIFYEIADGTDQLGRVKSVLPDAYYANQALSGRDQSWLGSEKVAELLARARVGLCLSAVEGAMRASMEYLLCGLCVVSTGSIGGRDRYLMPPYAMIVDADPAAVARGVREMIARDIPKAAVRDHIGRILTFERHHFLETVNRIARTHFGMDNLFASVAPFVPIGNTWRPVEEVIAPLEILGPAPPPARVPTPSPLVAEAPKAMASKTFAFVLASGRSGTHLLRSILSQAPPLRTIGEVFNQDIAPGSAHSFNDFFLSYIDANPAWRMSAAEADGIIAAYFERLAGVVDQPVVVVDVKEDQLRLMDWPSSGLAGPPRLLRFMRANESYPIIRVARRDTLSQYCSLLLAKATGNWQLAADKTVADRPVTAVRVDPIKCMAMMRNTVTGDSALDAWLEGRPRVVTLTYETMLDESRLSNDARRRISEALGFELPADALAKTVKLAPPLREYVENLDEVLDALKDTPFAWLRDLHSVAR